MANQAERSTPRTTTTQSRLDSLTAFLSHWSEDSVLAPTLAGEADEEEKETEHQTHSRWQSSLEYLPAASDLPSGALRRRSIYSSASATADHNDDGDGAMGMNSPAANSSFPPPPLPFPTLNVQRQIDQEEASLHQERTSNVPPSSALTSLELDKDKEPSARPGGGGGGILSPPPPLLYARPSEHRVDTDTSEAPPSASTSSSITARPPAA